MRVSELKVTPHTDPTNDGQARWMVDGETLSPGPLHVRVLHQRLWVFAPPRPARYGLCDPSRKFRSLLRIVPNCPQI